MYKPHPQRARSQGFAPKKAERDGRFCKHRSICTHKRQLVVPVKVETRGIGHRLFAVLPARLLYGTCYLKVRQLADVHRKSCITPGTWH
jgi:hypothetical protein